MSKEFRRLFIYTPSEFCRRISTFARTITNKRSVIDDQQQSAKHGKGTFRKLLQNYSEHRAGRKSGEFNSRTIEL